MESANTRHATSRFNKMEGIRENKDEWTSQREMDYNKMFYCLKRSKTINDLTDCYLTLPSPAKLERGKVIVLCSGSTPRLAKLIACSCLPCYAKLCEATDFILRKADSSMTALCILRFANCQKNLSGSL